MINVFELASELAPV